MRESTAIIMVTDGVMNIVGMGAVVMMDGVANAVKLKCHKIALK